MKRLFIFIVFSMIFLSCVKVDPNVHYHYYFVNHTDQDLNVGWSYIETNLVMAHSVDSVGGLLPVNKMEELFGRGPKNYDDAKSEYSIRVFDVGTDPQEMHRTYYCDQLQIWYCSLNLDAFQRLNWRIEFPPTEDMKDLEMIPSYEEIIAKYGSGD